MTTMQYYDFKIPTSLQKFIDSGVLQMLSIHEDEKYLEFYVPSRRLSRNRDKIDAFSVIWIHPDFIVEFRKMKVVLQLFII